jgi:hypothetical protein
VCVWYYVDGVRVLGENEDWGNLDPGFSREVDFGHPGLSEGWHTVKFVVDPENTVLEDNENNNEIEEVFCIGTCDSSPVAQLSASPTTACAGQDTVTFDGSYSYDPDGSVVDYWFDYGDGFDSGWTSNATSQYIYASDLAPGTYYARLRVRDDDGNISEWSTSAPIVVNDCHAEWTFMLYFAGDQNGCSGRNLTPYLKQAVERIAMSQIPGVNVIVLLDESGAGNTTQWIFESDGHSSQMQPRGELELDRPATLTLFALEAMNAYPADHYFLAVANHGAGIPGIAYDDASGQCSEQRHLDASDLRAALQAIHNGTGKKIDVLFYDACLMGLLEHAYQIKDYADYIVFSQNLGWSLFRYDAYIASAPGSTPRELAASVVSIYDAFLLYPRTMSAVDLAEVGSIADAADTLAGLLDQNIDSYINHLSSALQSAQRYEMNGNYEIDVDDQYVDLYDLARLVKLYVPNTTIDQAAQMVMDSIDSAVVVEKHASGNCGTQCGNNYWNLDNSHGISTFFPASGKRYKIGDVDIYEEYMSDVYAFTVDTDWDELIQDYFGVLGLPVEPPVEVGVPEQMLVGYSVYLPIMVRE